MAKARDTDSDALQAFKDAFTDDVPLKKKDAKIRLGKAMIALNEVDKALEWAAGAGFPVEDINAFRLRRDTLFEQAEAASENSKSDMKVLERLKKDCRHLCDLIHKLRAKKKFTDIPDNAGIYITDVPGLDELTPEERTEKITEVRQQVCRGSNLVNLLRTGDTLDGVAPTKETVVDVCWYLKGMAQQKLGEPYEQGALTISDPDGKLAKFLDNCPDVYPRDSSHLRPQQRTEGSQGRGIDVGGRFPGGMNTVLYHAFTDEEGNRRLYIKLESAGAHSHVGEKREVFRRPKNEEDEAQAKEHAKSFMSTKGSEGIAETREGTVDLEVQATYKAIHDAAGDLQGIVARGKQRSKQNKEGKVTGFSRALSFTPLAPDYWDVQTMTANINRLQDALALKPATRILAMQNVIQAWHDAMRAAGYDVDGISRLGDEVVLMTDDISEVESDIEGEGDIDRDTALMTMYRLFLDRKALQAGLLEGTKKNVPYVYYKKLRFDTGAGIVEFNDVLNLDTQAKQFEAYAAGTQVANGNIDKGTNLLKKKYFKYSGPVSQTDMFSALRQTGWNLANLTRADQLERK